MTRWFKTMLLLLLVTFVAGPALGAPLAYSGVVNVNSASRSELMMLPGIGEAKAEMIVQLRQKTPFTRLDDLLAVKGIGDKLLAKVAPYIVLSGPTTFHETTKP